MKAIIRLEVPDYQIGEEVSCYFKDTMSVNGICENAEPCEDAISRQYLIDKAVSWDKHFADGIRYVALTDILNAPPVKPQPKMGHWYKKPHEICYTCDHCRTTNAI